MGGGLSTDTPGANTFTIGYYCIGKSYSVRGGYFEATIEKPVDYNDHARGEEVRRQMKEIIRDYQQGYMYKENGVITITITSTSRYDVLSVGVLAGTGYLQKLAFQYLQSEKQKVNLILRYGDLTDIDKIDDAIRFFSECLNMEIEKQVEQLNVTFKSVKRK